MAELTQAEALAIARQLLPPNAHEIEHAVLAAELVALSGHVPERIRATWDPARIDAALLPYLAWALSVDAWDDAWPEALKRSVIAASPMVHRRKGTVDAIVRVLTSFGVEPRIVEWWQDETGTIPRGHFAVEALVRDHDKVPGDQLGPYVKTLRSALRLSKPKSRPMELRAKNVQQGVVHVGALARMGGIIHTRIKLPTDQFVEARTVLGMISRLGGVFHTRGLAGGAWWSLGPDIYVDSVAGSDLNDGRAATRPLRTLAAARELAERLGDGVRIGLVAGSEWRESLDLSNLSRVTVTATGDVAANGLPVIRADDPLPETGWQTAADRGDALTSTYSREVSWTVSGGEILLDYFEDEGFDPAAKPVWVLNKATVDATPGSWCVTGIYNNGGDPLAASGTGTLFVHPFGSTDPRSDGKARSFTTRDVCLRVGDDSTVRRVFGRRNGHWLGSIIGGLRCTFDHCLMAEAPGHCGYMHSGLFTDCVGWMPYDDGRVTGGIILEFHVPGSGAGLAGTWRRCVAVGPSAAAGVDGFGGHTNGAGFYDRWLLEDCAAVDCAIGGNDVTVYDIVRPNIVDGFIRATAEGVDPAVTITDPQIRIAADLGSANFAILQNPTVPRYRMAIDGLRLLIDNAVALNVNGILEAHDLELTGSVLVIQGSPSPRPFLVSINQDWAGASMTIERNIFKGGANEGFVRQNNTGATLTADNNVYDGAARWTTTGGGATTLSAWQTATSQDANSLEHDPSTITVADPANGDWTVTGDLGATGAGLLRPVITYLEAPLTVEAAELELRG